MNKEREISEKSKNVITAICVIIIILSIGAFALITADMIVGDGFVYQDSLEETILTVGDEAVSLKEISYYILVAESNYNEAAQIYNEENLNSFWNINVNFRFFRKMAKQSVLDACTRDNIYYQQALLEENILSEEETEEIQEKAAEEMNKLTEKQLEITEYQMSDMVHVLTKIAYARKYVSNLMAQGYAEEELDTEGSRYEEIKKDYPVQVNDEIWGKITLGKVTINN